MGEPTGTLALQLTPMLDPGAWPFSGSFWEAWSHCRLDAGTEKPIIKGPVDNDMIGSLLLCGDLKEEPELEVVLLKVLIA